jgi:hypothetical protein
MLINSYDALSSDLRYPLMNRAIPAVFLLIASCGAAPPSEPPGAAVRTFDVLRFFEGRSEGEGTLKIVLRSPQMISVKSRGRIEPDGALMLVQDIDQQGKAPRTRHWRMREVSPGRYSGELTDAVGPVEGQVTGNLFRVAYPMKGGFKAEQQLTLRPDGRTVDNVMQVKKLGVVIATLRETITKLN